MDAKLEPYIRDAKRIVVLCGAGISTAAGIPDYRSSDGVYNNHSIDVFDIKHFKSNPVPFYTMYKDMFLDKTYEPTEAHHFMKLLHDKGKLLGIFTQNIDGLEQKVGIPPEKIIQWHGTLMFASCETKCMFYNKKWFDNRMRDTEIPTCRKCKQYIKPCISFYGEHVSTAEEWSDIIEMADLVIIMGTTLKVYPFAKLITYAKQPRILVNNEIITTNEMINPLQFSNYNTRKNDIFIEHQFTKMKI